MQVAETILQQLGGRRFIAMTGAKHFVGGDDMLSFQIAAKNDRKIKGCRILLTPSDTYTMTFLKKAKKDPVFGLSIGMDIASVHENVYAEDLQRIFTSETGLETRL